MYIYTDIFSDIKEDSDIIWTHRHILNYTPYNGDLHTDTCQYIYKYIGITQTSTDTCNIQDIQTCTQTYLDIYTKLGERNNSQRQR